jgi:hypothetical protein
MFASALLLTMAASASPSSSSINAGTVRFINLSFSGSYAYVDGSAAEDQAEPLNAAVVTKSSFRGTFKNVPVHFVKERGFTGGQVWIYSDEIKGTISGAYSISSGGKLDRRYNCDVPRTTFRVPASVTVSGQEVRYDPSGSGRRFPGRTWYEFVVGAAGRPREPNLGITCPWSSGLAVATILRRAERRETFAGPANVGARWYLARKQTLASMAYPLSGIYRGVALRPLDMKATNLPAEPGGDTANTKYTRVNVTFRVTSARGG